MWKDPIVEEVRQYGNTYAAQFHEDLAAMFHDLQEKQKIAPQRVVSMKPKHYVKIPCLEGTIQFDIKQDNMDAGKVVV